MSESKPTCGWNESKPLTQADYVMTVETARDRALLIVAQDTDAPKLTDRIDAECMRVLVSEIDALRASLAAAEAKLADERKHGDAQHVHADMALWHLNDRRYQEAKKELEAEGNAHAARRAARDGQEETR